jgi:hypothetical protein
MVGFAAMRWSRRHNSTELVATDDPAMEERLDDELRDLD